VPRYLLDTNICIYIRQNSPMHVAARFRSLLPGDAVMSVVTYGELRFGVTKSSARQRALETLEALTIIIPIEPLPAPAGGDYGEIRALLFGRGEAIGNNDLWIAAHARSAGYTLVTNHEREFRRVPGLMVENWALV
jgi:tRNA(fMet)-specific endonuclease VapC